MRTAPKKAMSTSIMLIMTAVIALVAAMLLISMLQKPASKTKQVGEDLKDLSPVCDIKCFECCQKYKDCGQTSTVADIAGCNCIDSDTSKIGC